MVKQPKKVPKTNYNPINRVQPENKTPSKSRQQIYKENYQKNRERKKQQRRERYQQDKEREKDYQKERYWQQKEQAKLTTKQQQTKYYGAEAFKVLMSFKEYTELNPSKKKLWLDFNWTLKDCAEGFKAGLGSVEAVMKLEQVAGKLRHDYWETAKNEEKQKGKSWNLLDYDEQQKLIRYWAYEKTRVESGYTDTSEQLERQSQAYLKKIEIAKFHEERGKIGCECWQCAEKKEIQAGIKQKWEQELKDFDQQIGVSEKEECPHCGKLRELDEETGACKKCSTELGLL